MLRGIDPILSPELLHLLGDMGHGDTVAIGDSNFPASSMGKRVVRLDGIDASRVLKAVLSVLPIDTFVDDPLQTMQPVDDANTIPDAVADFQRIIHKYADHPAEIVPVERFAFYENAKGAYVIIQSGEARPYGNIILKKGVIFG